MTATFLALGAAAGVGHAMLLGRAAGAGHHALGLWLRLLPVGVVLVVAAKLGHPLVGASGGLSGFGITASLIWRRLT